MKVFDKIGEVQTYIAALLKENQSLGLVPTMGALHLGHISLVKNAINDNDCVAVSIFINPEQFNNPDDLEKYPRCLERDLELLSTVLREQDFIFVPSDGEMYPEKVATKYDFGPLADIMEGQHRPGHFNGVGIVVNRLFRIIQPGKAYFGEKDFQQLAIIRKLVAIENLPVEILPCPIIREANGLAMSSRNERLTPQLREDAAVIHRAIERVTKANRETNIKVLENQIKSEINSLRGFETEYVIFADEQSLSPVNSLVWPEPIRCFVAVWAGKVRLIDNIVMN